MRVWERASWATARTTGPALRMIRSLRAGLSEFDAATSNTASTREAVTFACWPPGPEDLEVFISISESGMKGPPVGLIPSARVPSSSTTSGARLGLRGIGPKSLPEQAPGDIEDEQTEGDLEDTFGKLVCHHDPDDHPYR